MTKIFTSDILIADTIVDIEGNEKIQRLINDERFKGRIGPGKKAAITREEFAEFVAAVQGAKIEIMPGGSSANTLTTLSRMLGQEVEVDFMGVVGNGMYSEMIRQSLDETGIRLLPEKLPEGAPAPEAAVSFVLRYPDGERSIVTYPGNAKEILTTHTLKDEMVRDSDILFVQGSLWQKLNAECEDHRHRRDCDQGTIVFADMLTRMRRAYNKELWLALPTHAEFAKKQADFFQKVIPSATVVMGNIEELCRISKIEFNPKADDADAKAHMALKIIQETFKRGQYDRHFKTPGREQVAFITLAEKGCAIVTANEISYYPASSIKPEDIVNTLGAGDTSFAGFSAGYLSGFSYADCARLAMELAGCKLRLNGPRLQDPLGELAKTAPDLAERLREKLRQQPGLLDGMNGEEPNHAIETAVLTATRQAHHVQA